VVFSTKVWVVFDRLFSTRVQGGTLIATTLKREREREREIRALLEPAFDSSIGGYLARVNALIRRYAIEGYLLIS